MAHPGSGEVEHITAAPTPPPPPAHVKQRHAPPSSLWPAPCTRSASPRPQLIFAALAGVKHGIPAPPPASMVPGGKQVATARLSDCYIKPGAPARLETDLESPEGSGDRTGHSPRYSHLPIHQLSSISFTSQLRRTHQAPGGGAGPGTERWHLPLPGGPGSLAARVGLFQRGSHSHTRPLSTCRAAGSTGKLVLILFYFYSNSHLWLAASLFEQM